MFKVVIDTNVFISAFYLPGSRPAEVVFLARRKRILNFISPQILKEIERILQKKLLWDNAIRSVINNWTCLWFLPRQSCLFCHPEPQAKGLLFAAKGEILCRLRRPRMTKNSIMTHVHKSMTLCIKPKAQLSG
ncbi:MAG: putative toxin-antitoxin system toxin component, PIN family [Desulfobacca sp. RBG_16_60_12]|nr:MAG: putative toxin-antitoxin system toxin component, PIN family [Desulfobacca sp. RBG_16_60_12]